MKISDVETNKALANGGALQEKILPEDRPRGLVSSRPEQSRQLTPLERGMVAAEEALAEVPDIREDLVNDLKERISKGEYNVSGQDIAEMMLRRRAADRIR